MRVPSVRYTHMLFSGVIMCIAVALHRALLPELQTALPGLIYLPAVGLCAFIGGIVPGVLAVVVALLASRVMLPLLPPHDPTWIRLVVIPVLFASGSTCIILVCEALRRAEARARAHAEQVAASERRLRVFTNSVPVMLWVETPDGAVETLNRFAREFSGLDVDAVQNMNWATAIHRDDAERIVAAKVHALRTGEEFSEAFRCWHVPSQEFRWIHATTTAVREADGTISRWVGCGVDIDDRVLAQEALRERSRDQMESLDLLDTLFDKAPIGFGYLDTSLRYLRVNETLAQLNRVSAQDTVGRSVSEVMPDTAKAVLPMLHSILETGEAVLNYEQLRMLPDGDMAYRVVSYYPVHAGGDEIVGIGALVQDVTDRRLAEAAVVAWRTRYEAAIEAGGQLVFDWTPGTCGVTYGGNVSGVLGHESGELAGGLPQWLDEVVHPGDRAYVQGEFEAAALSSSDNRLQIEYRIRRADGVVRHVEHTGRFLADTLPAARRLVGFVADITDRVRRRDDMQRRAEELRASNRAKEQFLAMLAHELRNPLAAMLHADYALEESAPTAEQSVQLRGIISRQTQHLARLVDDLLDVSRVTQGKVELKCAHVSLGVIAERAAEACRSMLDARRHAFTVLLPAEPVWVSADVTRFEQVIVNLLTNAAKFTDPGGTIDLELHEERGVAMLSVRDSGVGMAPEMIERAFDLFTQAEGSLDRSRAGLGIGLTLVRTLVELHGGTVVARSAGIGKGSEFTVHVPCVVPAHGATATRDSVTGVLPAAGSAGGLPDCLRIMVVEDDNDVATALRSVLQGWGHAVTLETNGIACIRRAPTLRPDVLILDIGLPGADGFSVAAQLRFHPALADTAFVALSGYGQPEDIARSRAAGCDAHLTKPVTIDTLRAVLAAAPVQRRISREAESQLQR